MKIAKYVVSTSAIVILAMGLAFVLMSGIVIGAETSMSVESKSLKTNYNIQVKAEKERHKARMDGGEYFVYTPTEVNNVITSYAITSTVVEKETTAITNALSATVALNAYLKAAKDAGVEGGTGFTNQANKDARIKLVEDAIAAEKLANKVTLDTLKKTYDAKRNAGEATGKGRLSSAFTKKTAVNTGIAGAHEKFTLSPMGAMMITGLILTFIGGALVVTGVILKKREGNEPAKKKAA